MEQTLRPSYTVELIEFSLKDVGRFRPDANRRQVRPSIVRSITKQLEEGKHFESPLSVNRTSKGEFLFDGHHRFDALRSYLVKNKTAKIAVPVHIYDNLSPDEVKEEYTIVNKGTKQNTNDVVKQYEEDIEIFQLMKNGYDLGGRKVQFPVTVSAYGSATSIAFYRLVGAYMAATATKWSGGYRGSAFDFVDEAKKLGRKDVLEMAAFLKDFLAALGPIKNNPFVRGTPFTALMKLWCDNRDRFTPGVISKRFAKLKGDAQAHEVGKAGGSGATVTCHMIYKTMLNTNRQRYLFV